MLFLILLAIGACALGAWFWRVYSYLSRLGLKHPLPLPLMGDMANVVLLRENIVEVIEKSYNRFPDDRFVGRYEFTTPIIMIKDPELLKKITVKDFEHFVDRRRTADPNTEPMFGRNLVSLRGEEWKNMRSALSPMFTSAKIRLMVPFMVDIGDQMMRSLKTKIEQSKANYVDLDAKALTTRYANDVIATCAFGLDVNSQFEDNSFYNMSSEITTFDFKTKIKFIGFRVIPWFMSLFSIGLFPKRVRNFYSDVVLGAIKQREEMHIYRPDMIHFLMEAKKGQLSRDSKMTKDDYAGFATVEESEFGRTKSKTVWEDIDLVAQAVIFLFAGYETVSSTMAFLLYELAVNPDCQEKLLQEIRENEERNAGKFDYNSVQYMNYLDMVVSEVLRKWPGAAIVDRVCVKAYNLGKPNKNATKDVILSKGDTVQFPLWAFQRDPKYFPDPEKFDPERFSEANKHKIDPFVFMPFGIGPRNCIGSRFALCEVKVMAYQLLQHIEVSPSEKTRIPLRFSSKDAFRMVVEGGNWLRFKMRN